MIIIQTRIKENKRSFKNTIKIIIKVLSLAQEETLEENSNSTSSDNSTETASNSTEAADDSTQAEEETEKEKEEKAELGRATFSAANLGLDIGVLNDPELGISVNDINKIAEAKKTLPEPFKML